MFFSNLQLTDAGRALIVKALTGETLTFTKLGLGNGDAPADPTQLTELVNPCITFSLTSITTGSGCASLSGTFDNSDLAAGFMAKELGVYAEDPDDGEILYAYANSDKPTYIPTSSSNSYERVTMNVVVAVGDAENVTAIISEFIGYATVTAFNAHVENHSNPHEVTKAQVGLGNVPNVSTNNQTPTFLSTPNLEELTSGETMRVLFTKLKAAVKALIDHIAGDNPHGTTPASIGAATASHTHSGNDIASGYVNVNRGGTGKTSWGQYGLVYAETASKLSQVSLPSGDDMVLGHSPSGAPIWTYPTCSESGSYVGSNHGGSANRNTLHLNRFPSIIIIRSEKDASNNAFTFGVLFVAAGKGFSVYNPDNNGGNWEELVVGTNLGVAGSSQDPQVSWYHASSAAHQMNALSTRYYYTAIY